MKKKKKKTSTTTTKKKKKKKCSKGLHHCSKYINLHANLEDRALTNRSMSFGGESDAQTHASNIVCERLRSISNH